MKWIPGFSEYLEQRITWSKSCTAATHELYWGYKVIYSNSARFRLHYYFLNLHIQYAVLSIIIYFTFVFTLYK